MCRPLRAHTLTTHKLTFKVKHRTLRTARLAIANAMTPHRTCFTVRCCIVHATLAHIKPYRGRAQRPLRGGVIGRDVPPNENFCFSAGLRIWNEHMSVSSMLIMAPALSNSPQ